MARKAANHYVCQSCGADTSKWSGRCDSCGGWNTLAEERAPETAPKGIDARSGSKIAFHRLDDANTGGDPPRRSSGVAELDRVTGGGLVAGSAILVGGDPGIGKSTLLLQACARMAQAGAAAAYISGEESIEQIRLHARRLGVAEAPVRLAAATAVRDIAKTLTGPDRPDVVVIDSVQTLYVDTLESAPGTVAQVRTAAQELIRLAKRHGFTLILVGHVTKEGAIAGPRVMEHMVDAVLYFEGDRSHSFRILRAVKNRFGATDEIGVFEMTGRGLEEVANPSALFLSDREAPISGAAVFAGMEGTRPVLVEIEALVAPSGQATPRRAAVGWDASRLAMILAVLEARCDMGFGGFEVYLNVAGGLRIQEPAADLAVAAALVSARENTPVPGGGVVFGEIGLSGEVRAVGRADARLKEAGKLGFKTALTPPRRHSGGKAAESLEVREIHHVADLAALIRRAAPSVPRPVPEESLHG
ncbi:MAG: DNA repair protein RadA [Rhodospirillales bacterium]